MRNHIIDSKSHLSEVKDLICQSYHTGQLPYKWYEEMLDSIDRSLILLDEAELNLEQENWEAFRKCISGASYNEKKVREKLDVVLLGLRTSLQIIKELR